MNDVVDYEYAVQSMKDSYDSGFSTAIKMVLQKVDDRTCFIDGKQEDGKIVFGIAKCIVDVDALIQDIKDLQNGGMK